MNIIINGLGDLKNLGGGTVVLRNLVESLYYAENKNIKIILLITKGEELYVNNLAKLNIKFIKFSRVFTLNSKLLRLFEQVAIPVYIKMKKYKYSDTLYFGIFSYVPIFLNLKKCSFMQLNIFQGGYKKVFSFFQRLLLKRSLESANLVLFASNFHLKEVILNWPTLSSKSEVLYLGVKIGSVSEANDLLGQLLNNKTRFICYPSVFRNYKNHDLLIRSFQLLVKNDNYRDIHLVLIGDFNNEYGKNLYNKYSLMKNMHFIGHISHESTLGFIKHSSIVAFPSKYEGFGIGLIEAMILSVPLVTSNYASIPEVVNDCALILEDESEEKFCNAMANLLTDLKLREKLITKAKLRASLFTWESSANTLYKYFKKYSLIDYSKEII